MAAQRGQANKSLKEGINSKLCDCGHTIPLAHRVLPTEGAPEHLLLKRNENNI